MSGNKKIYNFANMRNHNNKSWKSSVSFFFFSLQNFLISSYHSVQFSCSVVFDSLWPHESQHTKPPCSLPAPGVHPNSCALSRWCHPAISSSVVPFSSCPQSLPSIRVFSDESTLCMRWPKYWSFSLSINPSNEHAGLVSFQYYSATKRMK